MSGFKWYFLYSSVLYWKFYKCGSFEKKNTLSQKNSAVVDDWLKPHRSMWKRQFETRYFQNFF